MIDVIARIEKLLDELAGQQLKPDDFWKPEWASIKEELESREWEWRQREDRRRSA